MTIFLLILLQNTGTTESISRGKEVFAQACSIGYCHGVAGTAGAGPRLRSRRLDENYVHQVTLNGIPESAMPAWKDRLSELDLQAVVTYVIHLASLTNPLPEPSEIPTGVRPTVFVDFSGPNNARRGRDLFFDATRSVRCATCHTASGRGISIGPDLRAVNETDPDKLLWRMRTASSQKILLVQVKQGESYHALAIEQDETWIKLYDLSSPLPVLRTVHRSQIVSMEQTHNWVHSSVMNGYTEKELLDLIPFLIWLTSNESG